jgi:hypothetical protein
LTYPLRSSQAAGIITNAARAGIAGTMPALAGFSPVNSTGKGPILAGNKNVGSGQRSGSGNFSKNA